MSFQKQEDEQSFHSLHSNQKQEIAEIQQQNKLDKINNNKSTPKQDQQNENLENQKKSDNLRWILLLLAVFSSTAGQVGFVFPAYFNIELKDYLNINDLQYNLLFSVQAAPNIVLPFFSGLLPKYFGLENSLFGIQLVSFTGHFLQLLSILSQSYYMLLGARLLVGIGYVNYSTLLVVQITQWFIGKEMGFSTSFSMMSGKMMVAIGGFFFSFWSGQQYTDKLYQPLLWLLFFGTLNLIACFTVMQLSKKNNQNKNKNITTEQSEKNKEEEQEQLKNKKSVIQQVTDLSPLYWLVVVVGSMVNSLYYPYINNIQVFLSEQYQITGPITNFCYVIAIFVAALVAPIAGTICDNTGNFRKMWSISSIFCILPFSMYYFNFRFTSDTLTAVIPPILIGFFYGTANIIRQPCLRYAVDAESYSLATGLSISFINGTLSVFPIVFGYILNMGAQIVSAFMLGFALIYLASSLFLQFYDISHNNLLVNHIKYKNHDGEEQENQKDLQNSNENKQQDNQNLDQNKKDSQDSVQKVNQQN